MCTALAPSSRRQQAAELGAGEQLQEALKLASMGGGGVEVEAESDCYSWNPAPQPISIVQLVWPGAANGLRWMSREAREAVLP
jgi:hypothetical protein